MRTATSRTENPAPARRAAARRWLLLVALAGQVRPVAAKVYAPGRPERQQASPGPPGDGDVVGGVPCCGTVVTQSPAAPAVPSTSATKLIAGHTR